MVMGTTSSLLVNNIDPQPPTDNEENDDSEVISRRIRRDEELEALRADLASKRDARRRKLAQVGAEMSALRELLEKETARRMEVEKEAEALRKQISGQNREICTISSPPVLSEETKNFTEIKPLSSNQNSQDAFQECNPINESDAVKENSDAANNDSCDMNNKLKEIISLKEEIKDLVEKNSQYENQVRALKDVANIGRELLKIRECQVNELNTKLQVIEETGVQYEKEVATMRRLRSLYEERARAAEAEHKIELERERARLDVANAKLRLAQQDLNDLQEKKVELKGKVNIQEGQLDSLKQELSEVKVDLATKKEELYHSTSQIRLVNSLLSQIISGPEVDLDRLAGFLEENHDLINEITTKGDIDSVASTLAQLSGGLEDSPDSDKQEIASNLSKVWRVLTELLSHHRISKVPTAPEVESCYKSVETPTGPVLVISVSKTFIRLKDLILEKNALVKEVGRLRRLNCHLETRMDEQESRLTEVTSELHSTWAIVNKLKTQHEHLHEHEMILRYELQQKRLHLNDLKKQLEKSRTQWAMAREKNSQTERDWKKLRAEFAMRKKVDFGSAESGYEDEQSPEDTDEEKSCEEDTEAKIRNESFPPNPVIPLKHVESSDTNHIEDLPVETLLQAPVNLECLENDVIGLDESCSQDHRLLPPIEEVTEENSSASSSLIEQEEKNDSQVLTESQMNLSEDQQTEPVVLDSCSETSKQVIKDLVVSFAEVPESNKSEEMLNPFEEETYSREFNLEKGSHLESTLAGISESSLLDSTLNGNPNSSQQLNHDINLNFSEKSNVNVSLKSLASSSTSTESSINLLPLATMEKDESCADFKGSQEIINVPELTDASNSIPFLSEINFETCNEEDQSKLLSPDRLPQVENEISENENFTWDSFTPTCIYSFLPPIEESPEENMSHFNSEESIIDQEEVNSCETPSVELDPAQDIVEAAIIQNTELRNNDIDKILEKREERLRNSENNSLSLSEKALSTSAKGDVLATKLESIHNNCAKHLEDIPAPSAPESSTLPFQILSSSGKNLVCAQRLPVNTDCIFAVTQDDQITESPLNAHKTESISKTVPSVQSHNNESIAATVQPLEYKSENDISVRKLDYEGSSSLDQKICLINSENSLSLENALTLEKPIDTRFKDNLAEGELDVNAATASAQHCVNLDCPQPTVLTDEFLRRREERLKRMEESCKSLFTKMGQTSNRSDEIASKLDQVHAQYGEPNVGNVPSSSHKSNNTQDRS